MCLKKLKKLKGTSHVRLLRDVHVGFAVKDGADEYPHIANWKTGRTVSLRFPVEDKSSIQPESITAESPLLKQRIKPVSFEELPSVSLTKRIRLGRNLVVLWVSGRII